MNICKCLRRLAVLAVLIMSVSFSALAQQVSRKSVAEDLITLSYSSYKLPMDLGMVMFDSWKLTDDAVECFYVCKTEEIYNSICYEGYDMFKATSVASFKEMARSNNAVSLIVNVDADRGMKYHYSSPSGKMLTLSFSKSDLLEYLGVNEITPEFREWAVRMALDAMSSQAAAVGHVFVLEEITKKSVYYKQQIQVPIEKGDKYNLAKASLNDLINCSNASLFPLYSLYLEKGYAHTIISSVNKRTTKSEISFEELAYIYEYVKEEQQKMKAQKEAEEAAAAEAKAAEAARAANCVESPTDDDEESIPFQLIDVKPTFQGGDANAFSSWVMQRLVYPDSAKKNKVQGRVTLQFTIATDGQVENVKVLRGADPALDAEAVRVVSSSPKWTPGMVDGKPVRVTYTFPIIFQI